MRQPHPARGARHPAPSRATPVPVPIDTTPTFPESAEKALNSVITFVNSKTDPKFKRSRTTELQQQLDAELFGLSKDSRRTLWEPMQRLRLLNILCNFYSSLPKDKDAALRYEYFNLIFCGREGSGPGHECRISLLVNLCTLAIQFPCYELFDDIATWFLKIQSDVYAKRIVSDLVEDFVLAPNEYELSKCIYPLQTKAFEFSCFFIVYSINSKTLCPQLISILGEWINTDPKEVLTFIAENVTLRTQFKNACIKPMISYDVERSLDDDVHDRFHCALTHILLQWRSVNSKNDGEIQSLSLSTPLNELIAGSDTLREFQLAHLTRNIRNACGMGHYSKENFNNCLRQLDNCAIAKKGELNDLLEQKSI